MQSHPVSVLSSTLFVLLCSCAGSADTGGASTEAASTTTGAGESHRVTYIVGGSAASGLLRMLTPSGDVSTKVSLGNPIEEPSDRGVIVPFPSGTNLHLSVENEGTTGTVECMIKIDDVTVAHEVADGVATATCEAPVP